MSFILSLFWFLRTVKTALFYFYLWQLKEYQVRRFIDHFRTYKGRSLFLNNLYFLKIFLLILFGLFFLLRNSFQEGVFGTFLFLFSLALILIYLTEILFAIKRNFKRPVFTKKTILVLSLGVLLEIVFISFFFRNSLLPLALLAFDFLSPLIFSLIVLIIQPLAVLIKLYYIKKAKEKIRKQNNLLVIGITGSYGKSSTKEFLADILSEKYNVLKTKENQNSEMGISRRILKDLKPDHNVFVVEMGAYGKEGIKLLADITKPKIGILTGINEQHLSLFGSQGNIVKTKYELIESLPEDGLAVFNGNNKYCLDLYKTTGKEKRIFSDAKVPPLSGFEPDIWAENIKMEKESVSFEVVTKEGKRESFKIKAIGRQVVSNVLASVITAEEVGMSLKEISSACSKIKNKKRMTQLFKGREGVNVIDSSYSSNPDGVLADLNYLSIWKSKKLIIMPCLIELGKSSKEIHRKIGKKIAETCDLAVITTRDCFEEIKKSGMKEVYFIEKAEEINNFIESSLIAGDVVLLEGRVPKEVKEFLE